MSSLDPISLAVNALRRDQLIPDVLPESFTPSFLLSVVYTNGKNVLCGNEFKMEETADEPSIIFKPMSIPAEQADSAEDVGAPGKEMTFVLAMLDPDAPSRSEPLYKSFRHWLITGLKAPPAQASNLKVSDPTASKTKPSTTPYRPPGPRPGSGLHRYIFLLFQEPRSSTPFTVPEGAPEYGAALEERRSWDAMAFGEKYGLKLVGANFLLMRSAE